MAKEAKTKKENNKHFWKDFKAELKKVIWPTPKQVANNTTAVISIVLLTAIIVFVLDLTFEKLNTHGVNRIRNIVANSESNTVDNSISADELDASQILENAVSNDENVVSDESNAISEDNTIAE